MSSSDASPPTDSPRLRILVVEDNIVNRKVAVRMLTRLGCQVDIAGNGLEAVRMVERTTYAAIFLDCMMPVMDGYVATETIRALPGPAAKTPIIALTANAMVGDRERCLNVGMDDYLSKPVEQEQLAAALARWTGGARETAPAPNPPPMPATAPIDPAVLEGFRRLQEPGEPDVVLEFIDLFLQDLPGRRAGLRSALDQADLERLRAQAHGLKSSAAYIGALELAQCCREVEATARAGDGPGSTTGLARLEREADRVATHLAGLRAAAAPDLP